LGTFEVQVTSAVLRSIMSLAVGRGKERDSWLECLVLSDICSSANLLKRTKAGEYGSVVAFYSAFFNRVKPRGNYMNHLLSHLVTLHFVFMTIVSFRKNSDYFLKQR
jgi:hypothetical protein